jgi:hypothetical protein
MTGSHERRVADERVADRARVGRAAVRDADRVGQDQLPSTPLPLFDGKTLDLQDLKDQVVVIRFLASW